jgi:arsenical pump membrane protein
VLLPLAGVLPWRDAGAAVARGAEVYFFLAGMMALGEFARSEGVFGWLAARTVAAAGGSRFRLLALIYGAGIVSTAFLSNDATIVILTPAVIHALSQTDAKIEPYVIACAFVANTASLLLPIANPSNLLFFNRGMPPLTAWFGMFGLASVAALALTFAALALLYRRQLAGPLTVRDGHAPAPRPIATIVLVVAAMALVATSRERGPLGSVTFVLGTVATAIAGLRRAGEVVTIVRGIPWGVLVLTAGLFVIVDALDVHGFAAAPHALFVWAAHVDGVLGPLGVAAATALASNVVTNLPIGLDVGKYVATAHPPGSLGAAALVGVNIGPNLTLAGSLATLLWIEILQRSGIRISARRFARVGFVATPLALAAAALLAR